MVHSDLIKVRWTRMVLSHVSTIAGLTTATYICIPALPERLHLVDTPDQQVTVEGGWVWTVSLF